MKTFEANLKMTQVCDDPLPRDLFSAQIASNEMNQCVLFVCFSFSLFFLAVIRWQFDPLGHDGDQRRVAAPCEQRATSR